MNVDFIRHASSEANESDVFAGASDMPLSNAGMRDAAALAPEFAGTLYEAIASSPSPRAFRTATLLFPNRHVVRDGRLIERGLGEWEGVSKQLMRDRHPDAFLPSGKMRPLFTPPGGEEIPDVGTRLMEFLEEQLLSGIERIAVVTHNGLIKTCRVLSEDLEPEEIFSKAEPNLSVHSLDVDERLLAAMREKNAALKEAIRSGR